ncbi:kinetochore-associated Ndc80 complex subunit nuf2 [Podila humilis]|nr:kinetochore-associated Ndc80 complex subunit nuf2 [Podila humilis]
MNNFRTPSSGASRSGAGGPSGIPRPAAIASSSTNAQPSSNAGLRNTAPSNNNNNGQLLFPLIKYESLNICLSDVRVPCTVEELQRPSAQKMLQVYEALLEVTTGSPTENCNLEDLQEMDDPSITTPAVTTKIMSGVGISDFTSRDLMKPEADRVRRVLSAVINFIKYREVNQSTFWQEIERLEEGSAEAAGILTEGKKIAEELALIERRRLEQEPKIEQVKKMNEQLATKVGEHKKFEVELTRSKSEVASERAQIAEQLRDLNAVVERFRQELDALRAQRVEIPENLENDLDNIPQSNQLLIQKVDQLRKQVQARFAAVERIESIPKDLRQALEMTRDTAQTQAKLQEEKNQIEDLKAQIERKKLYSANLKTKIEQKDRLIHRTQENMLKSRTVTLEKKEQLDKTDQEQTLVMRKVEADLAAARQDLEAKRRRNQERWQREAKYADEVTNQMEQLKRATEMYMAEIKQALRPIAVAKPVESVVL